MNSETQTLIERPYQEIVDDILTAIVGGVVNEPIIFDLKIDLYPLAEPAQSVRGVTGIIAEGEHRSFQQEIDFIFSAEDKALIWQEGGTKPLDESTFHVDYIPPESRSPLSDINVGSVNRTLGEAVGREIATVYQQINQAYLSGFIDTAKAKSLDLVVAILGIKRRTKDYAVGHVTFFRDPAVTGNITLSQGTLLATDKGEVTFQTTQPRTLQRGQVRIEVPIRAGDDFKGEAGRVDAGLITAISQVIAGVGRVTNFEATFLGSEDESDPDLRLRAKAALQAFGKATLAALAKVIFEERAELLEVWDPNSLPLRRSGLGTAVLLVESEPERFPSLRARIEETRAAGVQTTLVARYIFFKPRIAARIKGAAGLTPAGKTKIVQEIIVVLQTLIDALSSGDPASGEDLLAAIKSVEEVEDAKIIDAMTWRSDLDQPGAKPLVETLMSALQSAPANDEAALRSALSASLREAAPLAPTGRRIPDRGLLQGSSGQRATDDEIEAADFQVVAVIGNENWSIVLDIESADILLQES